ncbi:MAG: 30S ribosomal protein S15, partial [Planctomycetes bacterium]|nr:30S ribosomal protein S15 [Planctomycetota bacterium]
MITKEEIATLTKEYGKNETDTGSTEVQIAILSTRIRNLTEHMRANRKDYHSQRGLLLLVGQSNKMLKYLARKSEARYLDLL